MAQTSRGRTGSSSEDTTAGSADGLVDRFFRGADDGDPGDRAAAVAAHQRLAAHRPAGAALVQVLRPDEGWPHPGALLQVVTDDMAYLVDSVSAVLERRDVAVRRTVHPLVVVRRDDDGALQQVLPDRDPQDVRPGEIVESWMLLELAPGTDDGELAELLTSVRDVLVDVRVVNDDTARMRTALVEVAAALDAGAARAVTPQDEVTDAADLLRWLAAGSFTLLGYQRCTCDGAGLEVPVASSGLGVLRDDDVARRSSVPVGGATEGAAELLVLTQASARATVQRPGYPFFVVVRTFDADGAVTGEHRFLGTFTVSALHENVLDIPVLARRTRSAIRGAGHEITSFTGQAMLEVVQTYPRAELFATDADTLRATVIAVLAVSDRRASRLFLRQDTYGRFVSCLVYLPRDRYTTRTRVAVQDLLLRELHGTGLEHTARVAETQSALLHVTVHTAPGAALPPGTQQRLQDLITEVTRTWEDRLLDALPGPVGAAFARGLPPAYKEDFDAARAVADAARLQALERGGFDLVITERDPGAAGDLRLTLYLAGARVSLSDVLPLLQSMEVVVLDERPYRVERPDGVECWIYDFGLAVDRTVLGGDLTDVRERFADAVRAMWAGRTECDRFNALVLRAGLHWRQAALVRLLARYLRQVGLPFSQAYVEQVVLENPATTAALVALFEARLDPAQERVPSTEELHPRVRELTAMIDAVSSLDADRILRALLAVVRATLRTSYWITDADGRPRSYLSVKLDPRTIAELPQPRPRYEIFVSSPRFEGVHLRFGAVARGGLRWSDRREDFRTEVLGLVKAQAVKNAVIVPVGAKGGFVLRRPPETTGDAAADREALAAEGVACYQLFISALLDLTDNLDPVTGTVLPPARVLRHDGDDTYLVVAADKGTATFSDLANAVAARYGYWLGDAFASGGSAGYDHKDMAITAKGAWEAVKRHFRELGLDTQSEAFSVVGVGDMSGDVFGNGMLLSEHLRLVAAFDHRHVFLDPTPDPTTSSAERARLFALPRSSWADYDPALLSAGGGVFPRTLKSVPVSPQVRAVLGLAAEVEHLTPDELVRAILLAPADLLWNGGIGTYVKAGGETHAEVGDKANDAVRVNGNQLRVRVVGEGGNLGLTQRGRIEYDRAGGRVNTDALDNSAGVDCSDHEVNIKILLDALVTDGTLPQQERNPLLESMTDEISRLVLADNEAQNDILGVSRAGSVDMLGVHGRLVTRLEESAGLDRTLEALPSRAGFRALAQAGQGLTSPELATLMAQVKLTLKHELLASALPESEVFARRLPEYFPHPLRSRFPDALRTHPLRREIVTTQLVNEVVDTGGISYVFRIDEETGADTTDAVRAHAIATEVFSLTELGAAVRGLGVDVPTALTDDLALEVRRLLDRVSRWFLANRPQPLAVGAEISRFAAAVAALTPQVGGWLCGHEAAIVDGQVGALVERGAPEPLARRVVELLHAYVLLDVVEVAEIAERPATEVAALSFALSEHLDLDVLLSAVSALERTDRWHALARLALRDDLYGSLRSLTLDVLTGSEPDETPAEKIAQWEAANASRLARARAALAEIAEVGTLDLAVLSVAARQVRSMVRGARTRVEQER